MERLPQLALPIPLLPEAFLSVPDCGVRSGAEPVIELATNPGRIHARGNQSEERELHAPRPSIPRILTVRPVAA